MGAHEGMLAALGERPELMLTGCTCKEPSAIEMKGTVRGRASGIEDDFPPHFWSIQRTRKEADGAWMVRDAEGLVCTRRGEKTLQGRAPLTTLSLPTGF